MAGADEPLRTEIERLRLSIDQFDADLRNSKTRRNRDALRAARLAAEEELARLWARLSRVQEPV
jgi:hypothetical protein